MDTLNPFDWSRTTLPNAFKAELQRLSDSAFNSEQDLKKLYVSNARNYQEIFSDYFKAPNNAFMIPTAGMKMINDEIFVHCGDFKIYLSGWVYKIGPLTLGFLSGRTGFEVNSDTGQAIAPDGWPTNNNYTWGISCSDMHAIPLIVSGVYDLSGTYYWSVPDPEADTVHMISEPRYMDKWYLGMPGGFTDTGGWYCTIGCLRHPTTDYSTAERFKQITQQMISDAGSDSSSYLGTITLSFIVPDEGG